MGCSSCSSSAGVAVQRSFVSPSLRQVPTDPSCPYTIEILIIWESKLTWFKSKALYKKHNIPAAQVNSNLGIVKTSLNISNRCEYKTNLDGMEDMITLITGLQNE